MYKSQPGVDDPDPETKTKVGQNQVKHAGDDTLLITNDNDENNDEMGGQNKCHLGRRPAPYLCAKVIPQQQSPTRSCASSATWCKHCQTLLNVLSSVKLLI